MKDVFIKKRKKKKKQSTKLCTTILFSYVHDDLPTIHDCLQSGLYLYVFRNACSAHITPYVNANKGISFFTIYPLLINSLHKV